MAWSNLLSNQMVSFSEAATSGFTLQSGQSHGSSNQLMTKADALAKYVLNASNMSGYANNQLVPKSVWVSAADSQAPSYANAEVHINSVTDTTIDGGWSGWTDNVGIVKYVVEITTYIGQQVIYSSPDLTPSTNTHTATGLSPNTPYYYTVRAFDAIGNSAGLSIYAITNNSSETLWFGQIDGPFSTSFTACSIFPNDPIYVQGAFEQVQVGNHCYLDNSGLGNNFEGDPTKWYTIQSSNGTWAVRIDNAGQIFNVVDCVNG